jgi:hypothetical protein
MTKTIIYVGHSITIAPIGRITNYQLLLRDGTVETHEIKGDLTSVPMDNVDEIRFKIPIKEEPTNEQDN